MIWRILTYVPRMMLQLLLAPLANRLRRRTELLGSYVVMKQPDVKLRIINDGDPAHILGPVRERAYKVEGIRDEWLWISAPGVEGWVLKDEVVSFDEALDYFTERINKNGNDLFAFNQIALAGRELLARLKKISEEMENAPDPDEVRGIRADLEQQIHELERMVSVMDRIHRGHALRVERKFDEALDTFAQALALDPEDAAIHSGLGLTYKDMGDIDQAIACYDEALRLEPSDADAYMNRGNLWTHKRDWDKALADYQRALRLDPENATIYANRSRVWSARKDYQKVIADCAEAIRLDPDRWSAHNNLAWLHATCPDAQFRDGRKAVESAKRACVLQSWENPHLLDTLAAACAEAGDFTEAVNWQRKAIELTPEGDKSDAFDRLKLYEEGRPFRQ